MNDNGNAEEVIKDLSQKLANTQVENSILFVDKSHLKQQITKLKSDLDELDEKIKDIEKLQKEKK